MTQITCPLCGRGNIKLYPKDGYYISLDKNSGNEKVLCPNCKRFLVYSVQRTYSIKK